MLLIKCWFALKQLFYFLVVLNSNSFPKSVIANCAQSGISGTVYMHSIKVRIYYRSGKQCNFKVPFFSRNNFEKMCERSIINGT